MNLTGNTILITGGATGIGLELTKQFVELGNEVIICGRRESRLKEAKKAIPSIHTIVCDVASSQSREELMNEIKKNYSNINILINNAGMQQDVDLTKGIEDLVKDNLIEVDINLKAPIYLAGMFVEHFKERKLKSTIINVSSGLGFVPMARVPIYCATKAAMHSYTLSLRHQLKDLGIEVIEVVPPAVVSELNSSARAKLGTNDFSVPTKDFVAGVIDGLKENRKEIGYGTSENFIKASRNDLDIAFERMNNR
ncbi:putative oxidoreductase [Clostridium acetobutylicum]|uniref:Short-chain dehydrodenase (Gene dltE) n=1 Tax=Clostridium acetobutylicum (strain ATCC 824 / DSM 792 / JCM 1419 / IAM 19013 / LMG 5710 / NBRC 13948 / NRRL B-527 / VKM B-1787 / 2291 / W) TaxID=272562 RepID=Q97LM1_CLOAB|nr:MULTISPECIES: SDR family oxidoreductase [Clostridium]AAK78515.1 Short-chain dehydrodenase (gene dltE) [Clostridium acetobutylicum ATCC 824]ADZ19588.1 Short-chain dehydrodenase (gene dltE) [Clostridium acetobutylicum EA 2018]AEI33894.1 Short-chain dehydrodenase, dltE [Clostridium acetobutylicum DSM 1731]AWV80237.1 SDR family NAD(P)-dependent oxidoreductase [Clostridium acetobutylicum]MBC2392422.1 SDR family NAD(P)-dependent oxidoreductase [Clostridium acetobutylicum]